MSDNSEPVRPRRRGRPPGSRASSRASSSDVNNANFTMENVEQLLREIDDKVTRQLSESETQRRLNEEIDHLRMEIEDLREQNAEKDREIKDLKALQRVDEADINAFTKSKWSRYIRDFRKCLRDSSSVAPTAPLPISISQDSYTALKSEINDLNRELANAKGKKKLKTELRLSLCTKWYEFYTCVQSLKISYGNLEPKEKDWYRAGAALEKLKGFFGEKVFNIDFSKRILIHDAAQYDVLEKWIKQEKENPHTSDESESEQEESEKEE